MQRATYGKSRKAFTVIELLVVVSIIALLVGILLPAIGKARDQARLTISQANLRNLGTAHQSYGAEWGDRQVTYVPDSFAAYGANGAAAVQAYIDQVGYRPPDWFVGWGSRDGDYGHWRIPGDFYIATVPFIFTGFYQGTGAYRAGFQGEAFHQYVGGRYFDKVFYAPKDTIVFEHVSPAFEDPGTFSFASSGDSSYSMSPAAMFNPSVFKHSDEDDDSANGFVNPWDLAGGMRSPSFSQCLYPSLKTLMIEHHWLQGAVADCNPGFSPGSYGGCEPYYFNHAEESSPVTLFYDGHVGSIGVKNAMAADARMRTQTDNTDWGLWSKDTPMGDFFHDYGYGNPIQSNTSFHMFTTDGIRGRDVTTGG